MSAFDTHPESLAGDSATLRSQRLWRSAGEQDLDFESQRLRNRLRAKMFGVDAAPISIGRFRVLETVGSGGMGVVYAAYDEQLDRRVAVKLLRATREDDASVGKGRLLREAQALAKLSHPNVVQVYEVGTFNDRVFLAMEFLAGHDLRAWLLDEPRPWPLVLRHFIEAGRGLAAAHEQGIIHRDFKPANLLFGADGRIRVVDFGLARASADGRLEAIPPGAVGQAFAAELTQTGEIMGTPAYMSPEQARHELVDARSDQYGFCVALYEALFGVRPHTGRSTAEVLVAVAEGHVNDPPRSTKVPAPIVRAVMRGLSADPAHRFATMDELLEQLSPRERRRRWQALGLGVLAVGGIGAFMLAEQAPCPAFEEVIADAWGPEPRAAIAAAFADSGARSAAPTLDIVDRHLEAYAEEWLAARRDTCQAHYVSRDQSARLHDLRAACLAERHAELAAVTQGLAVADPALVEQAPQAVADLSPIAACNDIESLQRKQEPEPVGQDLRVRLAQAQAQYKLGRYEAALQALDGVSEAAREHGAPELEAASSFHRGVIHQRRRVHAAANAAFEQTIDLAEEGADDELVARAWIHLAQGQAILDEVDQAERSLGRAHAKVRRLGDERLGHELREAQVVAAWQAGRLDEATAWQQSVVERVQNELGDDHPRAVDAQLRLAHILGDSQRHREAQQGYMRALETLERVYGPEHPALARVWFDIGMDHRGAGHLDAATKAFEEAERRFVAALGDQAPELVDINKALAHLAEQRRDLDEADRRIDKLESLARQRELPPREQLDVLSVRATVAAQRGDHAAAVEVCRAYFGRLPGVPRNPVTELQALFMRAVFIGELGSLGHHGEAETHARTLLQEIAERPDDAAVAGLGGHAWLAIGRASEARDEPEVAATAYGTGLELVAKPALGRPDELALRARLEWGLARVLLPADAPAALASAAAARSALAKAEPEAPDLAELDAWLRIASGHRSPREPSSPTAP